MIKLNELAKLKWLIRYSAMIGPAHTYKPYINYDWSVVGNELVNKGTSTNAEMFTGRALSFDSASSQSIDETVTIASTSTSMLYTLDGVATYTETPFGLNATTNGVYGNLIYFNTVLTQAEIDAYTSTPHTFLYKTESGLASDSGLDVSKVVSWFPMTEDDGYVRDVANYSEAEKTHSLSQTIFTADEISSYTYIDNTSFDLAVTTVGGNTTRPQINSSTESSTIGSIYVLEFDAVVSSGLCEINRIDLGGLSVIYYEVKNGKNYIIKPATTETTNFRLYFNGTNLFDVSISNISVKEVSSIFPITNYTTDMPLKGLNYGLQTAKLLLDDNGVVVGKSDFAEFYGDGYIDTGWIPSADEDFTLVSKFILNSSPNYYQFFGTRVGTEELYMGVNNNNNAPFFKFTSSLFHLGSTVLNNTEVEHILTYNSTTKTASLFLNKTKVKTDIDVSSFVGFTSSFYLGHHNGSTGFAFKSKNNLFKVHNKILTDEEIQAL